MMSSFFAALLIAKYWTVHIDNVADRTTYEELHKQEYAIQREVMAAHNVTRAPQWKFSTADGHYFNFRGRESLADFEKASATPDDVRKEISAKQAPLEPRIHGSLIEHHNEVWQTDSDVTSILDAHAAKFIRYHTDTIKPGKDDAYGEAQKAFRAALEKQGVFIAAFYSAYGDGRYHYLFMSEKPFNVKSIVGADVMKQWKDCVIASTEVDAKARPDLTLTDAANWIQ